MEVLELGLVSRFFHDDAVKSGNDSGDGFTVFGDRFFFRWIEELEVGDKVFATPNGEFKVIVRACDFMSEVSGDADEFAADGPSVCVLVSRVGNAGDLETSVVDLFDRKVADTRNRSGEGGFNLGWFWVGLKVVEGEVEGEFLLTVDGWRR
jgi:hypothetical protein